MSSDSTEASSDLLALRASFKDQGFYERPAAPIIWGWLAHCAIGLSGLAACVVAPSLPLKLAALLVSSFGFIGMATLGHVGSHNSAFRSSLANRVLFYLSYPVLLQLSACYWRYSHVQVHHPAPNIVGVDNDCDLRPIFAVNLEHQRDLGAFQRRWPMLQALLLLVILPFNGFSMVAQGWARLIRELKDPKQRGAEQWADLACLTAHLLIWIFLPMFFFSPLDVLIVYAARSAILGIGLFAVLAPGHYPAEAVCLTRDQRTQGDFHLRQGATTVNFRAGPIGRFLCTGLEYQIEHHFFPSVSHVHFPAIQPLVEAFCKRQGIPYRTLGWGEAIWKSWYVFAEPKPVINDVESLRHSGLASRPTAARAPVHQGVESADAF